MILNLDSEGWIPSLYKYQWLIRGRGLLTDGGCLKIV